MSLAVRPHGATRSRASSPPRSCSASTAGSRSRSISPRAAFGIQSDEATYYMMGHSLAEDGDFAYRREDLARVWREFPSGPSGVFLKKGTDLDVRTSPATRRSSDVDQRPDPDPRGSSTASRTSTRWRPRRSSWLFGTNGFLVLHAVLLALVAARGLPVPERAVVARRVPACWPPGSSWRRSRRPTSSGSRRSCSTSASCCSATSAGSTRKSPTPESAPRGTRWLFGPGSDSRPPRCSAWRRSRSPRTCC